MNCVILVGRLTRDPDIRYSQGQNSICIASFSVAVDRRFKKEGEQSADFPNVVCFGKTAEFIEKYFRKGQRIGLTGRIQTRSYENRDGQKVYVTEVVAENVEFVESKQDNRNSAPTQNYGNQQNYQNQQNAASRQSAQDPYAGFMDIPDAMEELPFV